MDPITAIVTAVAIGAAEALNSTAKQAVQDLYTGLKTLIQDKYHGANSSLEALEKKPDSVSKRDSLQEDLHDSDAANDVELLQQAQALLKSIEEHAPQAAQAIGLKWEDVNVANVRLKDLIVIGQQAAGVHFKGVTLSGDFEADTIKVGAYSTKKENP
jgi:predicted YcjX-like family ATPase